jgi:hypothetical protein
VSLVHGHGWHDEYCGNIDRSYHVPHPIGKRLIRQARTSFSTCKAQHDYNLLRPKRADSYDGSQINAVKGRNSVFDANRCHGTFRRRDDVSDPAFDP